MSSLENIMLMKFDKHDDMFEKLHIYFESQQETQDSYTVHYVSASIEAFFIFLMHVIFRITTSIPFSDLNLLVIHRACARIAHATEAAESCRRFFRDLKDDAVGADGSTSLNHHAGLQFESMRRRIATTGTA